MGLGVVTISVQHPTIFLEVLSRFCDIVNCIRTYLLTFFLKGMLEIGRALNFKLQPLFFCESGYFSGLSSKGYMGSLIWDYIPRCIQFYLLRVMLVDGLISIATLVKVNVRFRVICLVSDSGDESIIVANFQERYPEMFRWMPVSTVP